MPVKIRPIVKFITLALAFKAYNSGFIERNGKIKDIYSSV